MAFLFRSALPRHLMLISVVVVFFFFFFFLCGDLMGGFGSGWLFSLPFSLTAPPDADLCVFCFCFCFSVVVVLVSCCGGFSVRRWWGVDGWVGWRWMG